MTVYGFQQRAVAERLKRMAMSIPAGMPLSHDAMPMASGMQNTIALQGIFEVTESIAKATRNTDDKIIPGKGKGHLHIRVNDTDPLVPYTFPYGNDAIHDIYNMDLYRAYEFGERILCLQDALGTIWTIDHQMISLGVTSTSEDHPTYPPETSDANTFAVDLEYRDFEEVPGKQSYTSLPVGETIVAQNFWGFWVPQYTSVVCWKVPNGYGKYRWWFIPVGSLVDVMESIQKGDCSIQGRKKKVYTFNTTSTPQDWTDMIQLVQAQVQVDMNHNNTTTPSELCNITKTTQIFCMFDVGGDPYTDIVMNFKQIQGISSLTHEPGDGIYGDLHSFYAACDRGYVPKKFIDTAACPPPPAQEELFPPVEV